jgi:hypothetical protein
MPTPLPQTPIVPLPVRINFATGATAGIVTGQIQTSQILNYMVGADQNQPLIISVNSANNDVTFAVIGMYDGKILVSQAQKISSWQTMLDVSQDYLVQVIGGAANENFTLNINTPARVNFDPGAISATRKGLTPGGLNVGYIVRASAGQQMDLNLQGPAGDVVLSVYGYQDGNPYLRYVVEATTFSLKLPATQDYIIQVVPRAGQVINYTLTISIQ